MRIFAGDRVAGLMNAFRVEEDMPISSGMLTSALENAQKKVETYYYDIRKQVFEYDEVMNNQRRAIYAERRRVLEGENLRDRVIEYAERTMDDIVNAYVNPELPPEEWNLAAMVKKIKEFVNFVKDNPVTRFFFGDSNDKSLKAGVGFDAGTPVETPSGGGGFGGGGGVFAPSPDSPTFTGAPLEAYSPAMQAAILRREELKAETERLRQAREDKAAARAAATGGLSTADRINIIVNAPSVIDEEGFSRAVVDALNNSTYRGTNGATNFVSA
jgi:hypothetical protein